MDPSPSPAKPARPAPTTIAVVALAILALVGLASRTQGAHLARPTAYGADGLPADIPRPGSPAPTDAEWAAVTRPIRTTGEPPLACEAKMLREWVRVRCAAKGPQEPKAVGTITPNGHEEHVAMRDGAAELVARVVRGATYRGRVVYAVARVPQMFAVVVDWPAKEPRPTIGYLEEFIEE
jgi:hypothetical protein